VPDALIRLKSMPGLYEGLIVSTCNLTDFAGGSFVAVVGSLSAIYIRFFVHAEHQRILGRI